MLDPKVVGPRLKQARIRAGIHLEEAAWVYGWGNVTAWEYGSQDIPPQVLIKMARTYNISVAELIRGKEFISKQSHVESFMEGLISEEELSRLLGVDQIEARAIVQQIEQEKAEWVEELRRYEERIT